MKIYIDQSGKVEYTSKNTVIAYANGKQKSILIKAKDKREIEDIFRKAGKPNIFVYKTFALLIYLLIKDNLSRISQIIIDTEYTGSENENLIKSYLSEAILREGKEFDCRNNISFQQVGKKKNCHIKAINVFRGHEKAEINCKLEDILKLILKD